MSNKGKITSIVFLALDEVNFLLPRQQRLIKSEDTVLSGINSTLDSLGLVNLIVSVEQEMEKQLEISIVLADERAMAQEQNPFNTVKTLVDYISKRVNDKSNNA